LPFYFYFSQFYKELTTKGTPFYFYFSQFYKELTTKGTKITKRNNIEDPDPSGINNHFLKPQINADKR